MFEEDDLNAIIVLVLVIAIAIFVYICSICCE